MAPEQVCGGPACKATDVWGLGAILYECLTGRPPFVGDVGERLSQTKEVDPPPPSLVRANVPRDLDVICQKCLRKEPGRRYADAGELAADLGRWLRGEPIQARPAGAIERGCSWARRRPAVAALLALLALVGLAGLTTSVSLWRRAVAGEAAALENLAKAESALGEVEAQFAVLSRLLTNNVNLSNAFGQESINPGEVLADSETTLSRLVEKRPADWRLRVLLAKLLVNKGRHPLEPNALPILERAAKLLDRMPAEVSHDPASASVRVHVHAYLSERLEDRQRHREALAAMEKAYELHRELVLHVADPKREHLFFVTQGVGLRMLRCGHSVEDITRRFAELRDNPDLAGGADAVEMLLAVFASQHAWVEGERLYRAGEKAAARAAARRAAQILGPYYGAKAAVAATNHQYMIHLIFGTIILLNRAGASQEALVMAEQARRALPVLARGAGEASRAAYLADAWDLVGKCRWEMEESEANLEPFREALAAQRLVCRLAAIVDPENWTTS